MANLLENRRYTDVGPMGFEPMADRCLKGVQIFYALYEPVTLTKLSYGPIFIRVCTLGLFK